MIMREDSKARGLIIQNLSETAKHLMLAHTTLAYELWAKIKAECEPKGWSSKVGKVTTYFNKKMERGIPMVNYIHEMERLGKTFEQLMNSTEEKKVIPSLILLRELPEDWENIVQILSLRNTEELGFDKVKAALIEEDGRQIVKGKSGQKPTEARHALTAKTSGAPKHGKPKKDKGPLKCYYCDSTGHIRRHCPKWKADGRPDQDGKGGQSSKSKVPLLQMWCSSKHGITEFGRVHRTLGA